jgi:hypothetical protein
VPVLANKGTVEILCGDIYIAFEESKPFVNFKLWTISCAHNSQGHKNMIGNISQHSNM